MSDDIVEILRPLSRQIKVELTVLQGMETISPLIDARICSIKGALFCSECGGAINRILFETEPVGSDDGLEKVIILGYCENTECSGDVVELRGRRKIPRVENNNNTLTNAAD